MAFYALLLVAGLVTGSFLGMLTFRLPRGLSFSGRSFCDQCGKKILWYQNVPVVSFLALKGRCASCNHKISLRYPLIECLAALSFLAIGYFWSVTGLDYSLVFLLLLGTLLLGLFIL